MTTFREIENIPGVVYDAEDKVRLFAEDINAITGAINDIEVVTDLFDWDSTLSVLHVESAFQTDSFFFAYGGVVDLETPLILPGIAFDFDHTTGFVATVFGDTTVMAIMLAGDPFVSFTSEATMQVSGSISVDNYIDGDLKIKLKTSDANEPFYTFEADETLGIGKTDAGRMSLVANGERYISIDRYTGFNTFEKPSVQSVEFINEAFFNQLPQYYDYVSTSGFNITSSFVVLDSADQDFVGYMYQNDAGRYVRLLNNTGADFTLLHDFYGAPSGTKIYTPDALDLVIPDQFSAILWYDATLDGWRVIK